MSGQRLHAGINIGSTDPDAHRQAEPVMFGFWVFLMSDLVLFALLMMTYASMSMHGIASGPTPSDVADLRSAGIETALLLLSSFTFGQASVTFKYREKPAAVLMWLAVTALLGLAFLGMEVKDFASLAAKGHVPQRSGFLTAHFTLLGCHFLHVSFALAWMAVLVIQLRRAGQERQVALRLMRLALFWHMLDVVWVGIVTLVFLKGSLP